jgi:tetratricopeptide (TPR) repeat protein
MRLGDVTLMVAWLASAVALQPAPKLAGAESRRAAVAFFETGQQLFSSEQFERAAEEFGKATAKDPLFTLAYYQAGQAYMNLRRYPNAIRAFQECLQSTQMLYDLAAGDRQAADQQLDDEMRAIRESLVEIQAKAAKQPDSGYPMMLMYVQQQLAALEKTRASTDGTYRPPPEALLALGSAFFRNGDRDAAEAEWKAAIEVNPKLGEAHNNLAVIYMTSGRFKEADAEMKAAEKTGFRVNPQFKADLKKAASGR